MATKANQQHLRHAVEEGRHLLLAEDPDREVVVGTLVVAPAGFRPRGRPTPDGFKRLSDAGFAKATMNFRVEPDGAGGSHVTTETRVFATDAASRRRFAAYWRVIYPGSALIRRMWLRAIRQRAEEDPSAGDPRGRDTSIRTVEPPSTPPGPAWRPLPRKAPGPRGRSSPYRPTSFNTRWRPSSDLRLLASS